ncbi:MAG: glycerol-3-phosphate 1-O-acyltransferase PlsY [Candidatus Cloacimonetes bacterium]|nr:glycerol-3-phosphate 1-O-acyltransferase PlsY [Candidatus Cloacimonadota bacterium]
MNWLNFIISLISAYILGSIPFSYLFGKLRGIDIRQYGSGNVGATNALRVLGTKTGVITLLLDMGKGFAAVQIARILMPGVNEGYFVLIALVAIAGHIFTMFLKFKGGKGVATSAGVFINLLPEACLLALVIFIVIVAVSKFVSLGSIAAALFLFGYVLVSNILSGFSEWQYLGVVTLVAGFIIIRHKANIGRLMSGTENKISFNKKK